MFKFKFFENKDIQIINKEIKGINMNINKKEDDLKSLINEQNIIIKEMREALLSQQKEIINLSSQIFEVIIKFDKQENEIKNLNSKIKEQNEEINQLKNIMVELNKFKSQRDYYQKIIFQI